MRDEVLGYAARLAGAMNDLDAVVDVVWTVGDLDGCIRFPAVPEITVEYFPDLDRPWQMAIRPENRVKS